MQDGKGSLGQYGAGSPHPSELVSFALSLGARNVSGWTPEETQLIPSKTRSPSLATITGFQEAIDRGEDPLGDLYCLGISPIERKKRGVVFTPVSTIDPMLDWAAESVSPQRIIDLGAGSSRFLVSAGRRFPNAHLIACELDPLAAVLSRGHLAAAGMSSRAEVIVGDCRELFVPRIEGKTLYIGNPPYVRHHQIDPVWKTWLVQTANRHNLKASRLAGLHVYFFLSVAELAQTGDFGMLITAAEWMDTNYGQLVRDLLTGELGVRLISLLEPKSTPFPGTQTTAVITGFEVGREREHVTLNLLDSPSSLMSSQFHPLIPRKKLQSASRWTPLTRTESVKREGFVELGELCRVHRGQATGANSLWIAGDHAKYLPKSVLYPSVTRARELFSAGDVLLDSAHLRSVIDIPQELDEFQTHEFLQIESFLKFARSKGAEAGFLSKQRKVWWAIGLRDPAPILATYMARRPPVFVQNVAQARHINIAHGLYPRLELTHVQLASLSHFLSSQVRLIDGRTYAGGLTKFEPKEMERIFVPQPEQLTTREWK